MRRARRITARFKSFKLFNRSAPFKTLIHRFFSLSRKRGLPIHQVRLARCRCFIKERSILSPPPEQKKFNDDYFPRCLEINRHA